MISNLRTDQVENKMLWRTDQIPLENELIVKAGEKRTIARVKNYPRFSFAKKCS